MATIIQLATGQSSEFSELENISGSDAAWLSHRGAIVASAQTQVLYVLKSVTKPHSIGIEGASVKQNIFVK
jgi:hypothetical protein